MATACLRLFTFFPDRPDLSLPRFISCIARSTFLLAVGPYFRAAFFRVLDFVRVLDFLRGGISSTPFLNARRYTRRPRPVSKFTMTNISTITKSMWMSPPPMWSKNPISQKKNRTTIIVHSMPTI
jgi:hypothetical protein